MQLSLGIRKSTLYIVSTPIGNLQDITYRALLILRNVDYIAAEDTRRTRILLNFFSIRTPFCTFHQHNEYKKTMILIEKLKSGLSIALVSDAGTPLVHDPGLWLVQSCHKLNINVVPIPGPCAVITALCSSGLPANRFCFEGFVPSKHNTRVDYLKSLLEESRTLIFYDVKHRIINTLQDMISVFGKKRYIVLARELTKKWESIYGSSLEELLIWIQEDMTRIRGEMVLVLSGNNSVIKNNSFSSEVCNVMKLLALELPLKKASKLVSYIYGIEKKLIYNRYISEKLNNF